MTDDKPNLSSLRLVEFPPRKVEPPPPVLPDPGAYFVHELDRILAEAREAGLSEQDMRNLITAFVPDFPIQLPKKTR